MSALESTRIEVEGISARLLQAGPPDAEEAVVFMHGNPGSADDWEQLIAAVAGAADRVRVATGAGGAGDAAVADRVPAGGTGGAGDRATMADGAAVAAAADRVAAGGDGGSVVAGAAAGDDRGALAVGGRGEHRRALAFDLPDFGETIATPDFKHDVFSYASFTDAALGVLGVRRAHLVVHDFSGPIGLVWAAAHAERLASVTLIGSGILPGYRWHRMARIWRTPVLGELMQAITFRAGFRRAIAAGEPRGLPRQFIDRMYDQYDRRTRRAVLELYRATDDPGTAAAEFSAHMAPKDIPALVIWGEHDAYLPSSYAYRQREAFPSADVHVLPASGHWPFADSPETVERLLVGFLGGLRELAAPAPA